VPDLFWIGALRSIPTDGLAIPRMKDGILGLGVHGNLSVGLPSHPWASILI